MKRITPVALLFMMSLITVLFVGCTIPTYDQLPDNIPKGYVEFYNTGRQLSWGDLRKWDADGIETRIPVPDNSIGTYTYWTGKVRLRVAERPGVHTFIIKVGTIEEKVIVEVIEGMITPVGVHIVLRNGRVISYKYPITTYEYDAEMSLNVEKSIPFRK